MATATCTLCDLPTPDPPVTDAGVDGTFCCRGCLEVYRVLGDVAVDSVTAEQLRAGREASGAVPAEPDAADAPVDDVAGPTAADVPGPTVEDEGADASGATVEPADARTAYLSVSGMHCATCEAFVEATATEHEGVLDAEASYATDMVRLSYDAGRLAEADLPGIVSRLGYRAAFPADQDDDEGFFDVGWRLPLGLLLGMQIMMIYVIFLYPTYYGIFPEASGASLPILLWVLFWGGFTLFVIGFPLLRGAYVSLRAGQPNMDLLVATGALVAFGYSLGSFLLLGNAEIYVDVSTMIVVVVTLGDHVEQVYKRKAVGALADLTRSRVTEARVRAADGSTRTVDVGDCRPGDHLLVKPGERVPVDGTVLEGTAAVDQSLVTGESVPETKHAGDQVVGGAVVTDGSLVVEVGEDATSTLDRLVELLWRVQSADSGAQRLADRVAGVFVPAVVGVAVLTVLARLALGEAVAPAILTGVAVLVVSCPCSLGLATPLAIVAGIREAADRDVVVLHSSALERIVETDVVAFDKTGTLSTGEMQVVRVDVVGDGGAVGAGDRGDGTVGALDVADDDGTVGYVEEADLLARAAAVESRSSHPVADAIVEHAGGPAAAASDVERRTKGVVGRVGASVVAVGAPGLFGDACPDGTVGATDGGSVDTGVDGAPATLVDWHRPADLSSTVEACRQEGLLPVVVGWDGAVRGVIAVSDSPRPDWAAVVAELAADGRRVVVITGDDESMARRFEAHAGVDQVFAGVPPEAKVAVVERLRAQGTTTMVGDGTNDAPAIAAADLGIAMASGTDVAVDAADVVVTADDLWPVVETFAIARGTQRRVRQNLGWALAYNAVAIPLAVLGLINPLIAAVAMASSSLLVVGNSARGMGSPHEGRDRR